MSQNLPKEITTLQPTESRTPQSLSENTVVSSQGKKDDNFIKELLLQKVRSLRKFCDGIVNKQNVQMTILFLIVINSIFMGVGTYDFITEDEFNSATFEAIDRMFLMIFTLELVLQLIAVGHRIFLDGWLFFDFAVVVISWVGDVGGGNFQVMRSFRIFRALRLITRIQTMKDLVTALLSSLPSMSAVIFFMVIIIYIFAVMLTDLYKDVGETAHISMMDEELHLHFRSLNDSFFTLFQLTTLDGWSRICREFMKHQSSAWIPIVSFITISGIVIMNLVIAIICDSLQRIEKDKSAKKARPHSQAESDEAETPLDSENQSHGLSCQMNTLCAGLEEIKKDHDNILYTIELLVKGLQYHNDIKGGNDIEIQGENEQLSIRTN